MNRLPKIHLKHSVGLCHRPSTENVGMVRFANFVGAGSDAVGGSLQRRGIRFFDSSVLATKACQYNSIPRPTFVSKSGLRVESLDLNLLAFYTDFSQYDQPRWFQQRSGQDESRD